MLPVPPTLPTRPTEFSEQIEAMLRVWRSSWRPCLPFALLANLSGLMPGLMLPPLPLDDAAATVLWLQQPQVAAIYLWITVLSVFSHAALAYRQGMLGRGSEPGLLASMVRALQRLLPSLLGWLLYLLALSLLLLPASVGLAMVLQAAAANPFLALIGVALMLILPIPGAWFGVAGGLFLYAIVLERRAPLAALRRSIDLVRGFWWQAAALVSVATLAYLVGVLMAVLIGTSLARAIAPWLLGQDALDGNAWLLWAQLLVAFLTAPLLPLFFAGGLVVFNDLLLRREGLRSHST